MTTSPRNSIFDLPPLEQGGIAAREGFNLQDHVATGFVIRMMMISYAEQLIEVWCEDQDDITLIYKDKEKITVELVQVKGHKLEQLWTIAELTKRDKTNGVGVGTSIPERSLAYDRCAETCTFRLVTLRDVKQELKILTLPMTSVKRKKDIINMSKITKELKDRFPNLISTNGNDVEYWMKNLFWDVRHSEDAVIDRNLIDLASFLWHEGKYMSPRILRTDIYMRLLEKVRQASVARWDINPEQKRLKKIDVKSWFLEAIADVAQNIPDLSFGFNNGPYSKIKSSSVIISSIEEDIDMANEISILLRYSGIETWLTPMSGLSAREAHRKFIETVSECSGVILIASKNSILSGRVQSEVYSAMSEGKTIICVVIDDVAAMPDEWLKLKRITWNSAGKSEILENLLALLPNSAIQRLRQYLREDKDHLRIKQLLVKYPEWLPIEKSMFIRYYVQQDIQIPQTNSIDLLAVRPDSVGIKAFVYYFASPQIDFEKLNPATLFELKGLLNVIQEHATILCRPIPPMHPLHPFQTILDPTDGMVQWYYDTRNKFGFGPYGSIFIYLIAGQSNKTSGINDTRNLLIYDWREEFMRKNQKYLTGCGVEFDILSYSRLIRLKEEGK